MCEKKVFNEKSKFISETAAIIFASMITRSDKDESQERAIELAISLWDKLVDQKIISD